MLDKAELVNRCELLYGLILKLSNSRLGASVITKTPFKDLNRDDRITIAEIVMSYHRSLDNPKATKPAESLPEDDKATDTTPEEITPEVE